VVLVLWSAPWQGAEATQAVALGDRHERHSSAT
jgi:hypothetical protein